jgi:hypothetical protein
MILQGYFGLNWGNGSRKPVVHRSGFLTHTAHSNHSAGGKHAGEPEPSW